MTKTQLSFSFIIAAALVATVAACNSGTDGASGEGAATAEQAQAVEPTAEPEATEPAAGEPTSMPHAMPEGTAEGTAGGGEMDHEGMDHGEMAHAGTGDSAAGGGEMDHVLEEGDYDPADLVAQPGAAIGDITSCPVSGEVFRVDADSPYVEYEGQNVYFCCARCTRRFQRDPARYLED